MSGKRVDEVTKAPEALMERMEELLESLQKSKTLYKELMEENERLRREAQQRERDHELIKAQFQEENQQRLRQERQSVQQKMGELQARLKEIEKENEDFAERYVKIQEQNDKLLNLYVSTYQLHATLERNEVQKSINEILINLIGAEEYFICLLDSNKKVLEVVVSEGPELPAVGSNLTELDHLLEAVLREGTSFYQDAVSESSGTGLEVSKSVPYLACLPLRVKDEVMGVIAIKKLMDHKGGGLTSIDHELLDMLADHAATALVSSDLYGRVERKLRTAEGFMKLLKLKKDQE